MVVAWPLDPDEFRERVMMHREWMANNSRFAKPVQNATVPVPEKIKDITVSHVTFNVPSSVGVASAVIADNRPTLQVMLPSGRELRIIRAIRGSRWISLSDKETRFQLEIDLSPDERRALIDDRFKSDEQLAEWLGSLTFNDLTGERTAEQILKLNAMVLVSSNLNWRVKTTLGNAFLSPLVVRDRNETRVSSAVYLYDKTGKLILVLIGRIIYPKHEAPADTNELDRSMMSIIAGIQNVDTPAQAPPGK